MDTSPEAVSIQIDRLFQPFQAGKTLYCMQLDVEVSAAFAHRLSFPAAGVPSRGEGFEQTIWRVTDRVKVRGNRRQSAPLAEPRRQKFRVVIGTTHFVVDRIVRVKKLLAAPPTLTATASGHVLVIKDATHSEQFQEVQFAEGRIRTR